MNHLKISFPLVPKLLIAGGIVVVGLTSLGLYAHHLSIHNAKITAAKHTISTKHTSANPKLAKVEQPSAITPSSSNKSTPTQTPSTPVKTTVKATNPAAVPPPLPTPATAPTPNTTNCLPPNPSPYATTLIHMTNSQYLQTNGYANTARLYAAFQFAGLINTINSKQYVVLAMDDSQWNSLTQTQLDWMNASPANMRSVVGWQVITSCITWDGVNPVKNLPSGATQTVNTLNGPVTFTSGANGLGTFGNGSVAIWDWFTSNGSVTIAGFVKTP